MKTVALVLFGALFAVAMPTSAAKALQNLAVLDMRAAVPEISFTDGEDQPKTIAGYSGKVVPLSVWATWCAPYRKELQTAAEAMGQLGPLAERIQPLIITVDPERDTLPVLADYTIAFDPRILGLSGNANQIASAAKAYQVYHGKRVIGDDYYMDRTATIRVVRADGSYSSPLLSTASPLDIAKRMRTLLGAT